MSGEISFWQPLYYPQPANCCQRTGNFFDEFFCTDGERAVVVESKMENGRTVTLVKIEQGEKSYRCMKLFLIYTFVVAVFMALGKMIFRCCRHYQIKPPEPIPQPQIPTPLVIHTEPSPSPSPRNLVLSPSAAQKAKETTTQHTAPPLSRMRSTSTSTTPKKSPMNAIYEKAVHDKRPFINTLSQQLFKDPDAINGYARLKDEQIENYHGEPLIQAKQMTEPIMTDKEVTLLAVALRVTIKKEKFEFMFDDAWKDTHHGETIISSWSIDPLTEEASTVAVVIIKDKYSKLCLYGGPKLGIYTIDGTNDIIPYAPYSKLDKQIANFKQIITDGSGEFGEIKYELLRRNRSRSVSSNSA